MEMLVEWSEVLHGMSGECEACHHDPCALDVVCVIIWLSM